MDSFDRDKYAFFYEGIFSESSEEKSNLNRNNKKKKKVLKNRINKQGENIKKLDKNDSKSPESDEEICVINTPEPSIESNYLGEAEEVEVEEENEEEIVNNKNKIKKALRKNNNKKSDNIKRKKKKFNKPNISNNINDVLINNNSDNENENPSKTLKHEKSSETMMNNKERKILEKIKSKKEKDDKKIKKYNNIEQNDNINNIYKERKENTLNNDKEEKNESDEEEEIKIEKKNNKKEKNMENTSSDEEYPPKKLKIKCDKDDIEEKKLKKRTYKKVSIIDKGINYSEVYPRLYPSLGELGYYKYNEYNLPVNDHKEILKIGYIKETLENITLKNKKRIEKNKRNNPKCKGYNEININKEKTINSSDLDSENISEKEDKEGDIIMIFHEQCKTNEKSVLNVPLKITILQSSDNNLIKVNNKEYKNIKKREIIYIPINSKYKIYNFSKKCLKLKLHYINIEENNQNCDLVD